MADTAENKSSGRATVVVDLGKVRKSKIKALRAGAGKLNEHIGEIMDDLKQQGTIGEGAQPVVFVVSEKQKKCWVCG